MDNTVAAARPRKRKRRNLVLTQDDFRTADAIKVQSVWRETDDGRVRERIEIPAWTNPLRQNTEPERPRQVERNTQLERPRQVEHNAQLQEIPSFADNEGPEMPGLPEDESPRTSRVSEIIGIMNILS